MPWTPVWRRSLGPVRSAHGGGTGLFVVLPDAFVAFDVHGNEVWRHATPDAARAAGASFDGAVQALLFPDHVLVLTDRGLRFRRLAVEADLLAVHDGVWTAKGSGVRYFPATGGERAVNPPAPVRALAATPDGAACLTGEGELLALAANGTFASWGRYAWARGVAGGPLGTLLFGGSRLALVDGGRVRWSLELPGTLQAVASGARVFALGEAGLHVVSGEGELEATAVIDSAAALAAVGLAAVLVHDEGLSLLASVGEGEAVFCEVVCRNARRCGSFASVRVMERCPKCRGDRIVRRIVIRPAASARAPVA